MSAKQKERFTQLSWGFAEWTERHKDALDPEAIAVAAVLMGWPEANWSGVFIVALGALERRALLRSPANVREAMAKLEAVDFLVYCEDTRLVWIKNLAKRHCHGATDGKSRNVWSTLRSIGAPAAWFWADFWAYCEADLGLSQSGLSKPVGKSVRPASAPPSAALRPESHTPLMGAPVKGAVMGPLRSTSVNGASFVARITPRRFKASSSSALTSATTPSYALQGGASNGGGDGGPPHQSREVIGKRGEGPAREPAPARESIEGPLSISRSQLEAEIAESGAERGFEPDPKPLVAAGPLHPRDLTPEEVAILETPLDGADAFGDGVPMPELPWMKPADRRPLAERIPEMFGHLNLDVPTQRVAEAEAYDASRKADAEAKAAVMDPEDAAFEEALAAFMDMYKLDERVKKVMARSITEIPQGLEAHHDACRKAVAAIADRYSKAVGSPVVGQARAAIMRAVLMLVEDGRISVPGAVDRLMTMLDWWQAPDGNPKRRGEDGKDWFADATAVFGGKETLKSAAGGPRDAGVIIMAGLNASAAWKVARERKLNVAKDPFAATGGETYYGIMDAMKAAKAARQ